MLKKTAITQTTYEHKKHRLNHISKKCADNSILQLGQGNDVVLRPKIGKIVINPIPLPMYSIRAPESPLLLFALESMEKVVFCATPIWTVGKFLCICKMLLMLINTRHVGYQMKALDVRNPIDALILYF